MLKECLDQVRKTAPVVHNITNYVTVNDVANVILACGGSPIMSDEPEDVADITSICGGLNINLGTLHKTSIEGMLIGNDEMPFYSMDAMLPFTHLIEAEEIGKDCTYLLQADLEQLSTAMADGDEIEVKAAVGLNVLVFRQWEEQLIESVEEQPLDRKKLESMPGITVYIVKAGDTLWDIAKKFYTTVDEISGVNSLTEKEVKPGQSLILVRQG